jgi:hypothetical protein
MHAAPGKLSEKTFRLFPSFVTPARVRRTAVKVGHILTDQRTAADDRDVIALSVKCNKFVDHVLTDGAARFVVPWFLVFDIYVSRVLPQFHG